MAQISYAVDADVLSHKDVKNLALQRTSSLLRVPWPRPFSPSYYVWNKLGSDLFLDWEAWWRRDALIKHSIDEMVDEFSEIMPYLAGRDVSNVMDVGCGIGVVDILLARSAAISKIALVDIEENGRKHHGFEKEGAAYNSLEKAGRFVKANIGDDATVITINPKNQSMKSSDIGKYNLIVSFISCGFHYPAETYSSEFKDLLSEDGIIILDLRRSVDHSQFLRDFEIVETISRTASYDRVMLRAI